MTSLAQYIVVLTGLQLADCSRLLASRARASRPSKLGICGARAGTGPVRPGGHSVTGTWA